MTIKNASQIFLLILVHCIGLTFGMDGPVAKRPPLRDVDRVFLNACKNNKDIHLALSLGADKYATDPDNGWSGMHYACKNGNVDSVKFFLKDDTSRHGSVLNMLRKGVFFGGSDNGKDLPMVIAYRNGYPLIAQLLVDFVLLDLCRMVEFEVIPWGMFCVNIVDAFKLGANIDCTNEDDNGDLFGFTPLLYVCLSGSEDKVKFLLKKKANPNKKSTLGFTPLYVLFAKKVGGEDEALRYSLARLLIKHGADVTIAGPEKRTVLQAAIDSRSPHSVEMLSKKINKLTKFVNESDYNKKLPGKTKPAHKRSRNGRQKQAPVVEEQPIVVQKTFLPVPPATKASPMPKCPTITAEVPEITQVVAQRKTYAGALETAQPKNKQECEGECENKKCITIVDDHATITVPITQESQALKLFANQNNPIADLPLLKKVRKKKDKIDDFFHNFSSKVEDQLGGFMRSKILKKPTAKHPAVIQHSADATMMLHRTGNIFSGELQFIEQGNMITHRFFKPDKLSKEKSNKKNKKPLLLKSSGFDSKDALG